MAEDRPEERTVGQLVAQASQEVSELIRAEIALAKAELATSAKNGALGSGLFAVAGYLGFLASILLTIAAAYGLVAAGLRPWLAFLIVAAAFLVVAGIVALIGKGRFGRVGPPRRAIVSTRLTIAAVRPGNHAGPDGATAGTTVGSAAGTSSAAGGSAAGTTGAASGNHLER